MCPEITQIELRQLVGGKIRFLRKSKGWSQEELAEGAGLSYKFIGEVERGTVNPSLDTLLSISNALQVDIITLFSHNDTVILTKAGRASIQTALSSLQEVLNG